MASLSPMAAASPLVQAGSVIELTHEANTAYRLAMKAVNDLITYSLTDVSVVCGDPRAFARRARDYAIAVQLSFESFVGAVAADQRRRSNGLITFPWGSGTVGPAATNMTSSGMVSASSPNFMSSQAVLPHTMPSGAVTQRSLGSASDAFTARLLPNLPPAGGPSSPRQPQPPAPSSAGVPPSTPPAVVAGGGSSSVVSMGATIASALTPGNLTKHLPLQAGVASSIAIGFDALARLVRADEGVLLVVERKGGVGGTVEEGLATQAQADGPSSLPQAQALCLYGSQRSPSSIRVSLEQGVVGAVIRSGVALNISPEVMVGPSSEQGHMLCFPIFKGRDSVGPIGAIVLERRGLAVGSNPYSTAPFDAHDEALVEGYCNLVPQLIYGYRQRMGDLQFDTFELFKKNSATALMGAYRPLQQDESKNRTAKNPRQSKRLSSVAPTTSPRRVAGGATKDGASSLEGHAIKSRVRAAMGNSNADTAIADLFASAGAKVGTSADHAAKLSALLSAQPRLQLVLHSAHHSHFVKARTKPLHGTMTVASQNVVDVAAYVTTVEECWRRSADDVQALTAGQMSRSDDARAVRKQLKEVKDRNVRLEQIANGYRERYDELRRELAMVCDAPLEEMEFGDTA